MKVTHIPFQKTGFFSKTMSDYLEQNEVLQSFYSNFSNLEGFKKQLEEKSASFKVASRTILVDALKKQYKGVELSEETQHHIDLLQLENTFTITTGHQLNLFTGPLYFLYKIISVINLCEDLTAKFPKHHFVPIYWMATEDHDFDEINYFNFREAKVQWNRNDGGAVGQFSTDGLQAVYEEFSKQLGTTKNAAYLKKLFSDGYLNHDNLAVATRYIANELFSTYGLVIIDGDDIALKKEFAPFVKDELLNQTSFKAVSKTIVTLEKNYPIQVNPRETNLFYLGENLRERIIKEENTYKVNNTDITFSSEEILKELNAHPERFSPNVIMRPLYQEVVLPNLCYIGGGGELAYWLELKNYFTSTQTPFPILLLRNSVQIISKKQQGKLDNLKISTEELFLKQNDLLALKVIENADVSFGFAEQKAQLEEHFNRLKAIAKKTDPSFVGAVNAQEKKQLNGLDNLEKRLLRAEKRKHKDLVERIVALQDQLLPNQSLEERQRNFSEFYLEYGDGFIDALKNALKPLQLEFTILEL
ncbi:MAG: bacillithiol biosynthesis cysteine-adding enzyme BshC [Flavobacteriaceae bacterium]|nr:bacillithiol biosynthesis cysteine-adding enzyme BshC [Flavobacteriaceae bacterium]